MRGGWMKGALWGAVALLSVAAMPHAVANIVAPVAQPAPRTAVDEDLLPWHVEAPPPAGYDRRHAAEETMRHLKALVARDTQNPPGNERITADYFESVLSNVPGITTHVLDAGDGRANFIARLSAVNPTGRPVLVMGHMDTVGADLSKWDSPPYEPTLRDGYLYGRGVIDDKGMLAAATTALVAMADRRSELTRDIVFLATAAEEGGPEVGIVKVLEEHRELLGDPEFALNEGGRVRIVDGAIQTVNVQTTEKIYYEVIATAKGRSGHGSVPLPDNALAALSRAMSRIHEWRRKVMLNDTTRGYFEGLLKIETDRETKRDMTDLLSTNRMRSKAAAERLSERNPAWNAVLRTAGAITIMEGGIRGNVIPSEGRAVINVRLVPGDDIMDVIEEMADEADEEAVTFELDGEVRVGPPVSPTDTALYAAMESAALEMSPGAVVLPYMSTGGTDGRSLRAIGIPTYGINPFPMASMDELRMHGDNERAPVPAIGWGTEYIYRVLARVTE
jgi:acetylornithine deacetylase/succinyl-diaminopimelate desuccinylase-like protein